MVDPLVTKIVNAVQGQFEEVVDKFEEHMKNNCPKKSGALKDSISKERESNTSYLVGVDGEQLKNDVRNPTKFDYSKVVVLGHKGYTVRAKNKQSLKWIDKNGKKRFAKSVYIPPSKGNNFVRKSVDTFK